MADTTTPRSRPRATHGDGPLTRFAWLAPALVSVAALTVVVLAGWFQ